MDGFSNLTKFIQRLSRRLGGERGAGCTEYNIHSDLIN